jgi:hypothetical protein
MDCCDGPYYDLYLFVMLESSFAREYPSDGKIDLVLLLRVACFEMQGRTSDKINQL